MAKPIIRFKVNQQSAEVGGKLYGIVQDTPVTPENSILQICEFKKITAFTPEQVLRLVEDVCDGAAKLVARDGLSRQLSTLLKFSPRVRGTFASVDSRWTDQKLIVGARLLKDIKLDMQPSDFVMSNVADVGFLTSAAWSQNVWGKVPVVDPDTIFDADLVFRVNGSKLDTWDGENTFVTLVAKVGDEVVTTQPVSCTLSDFAANGFTATISAPAETPSLKTLFGVTQAEGYTGFEVIISHPSADVEFKRLPLGI